MINLDYEYLLNFGSYREFPRHELATLENNARACHIFKFLGQKCPNRRETMSTQCLGHSGLINSKKSANRRTFVKDRL